MVSKVTCVAGIGKSQMCMTLAAKACLPSGCVLLLNFWTGHVKLTMHNAVCNVDLQVGHRCGLY